MITQFHVIEMLVVGLINLIASYNYIEVELKIIVYFTEIQAYHVKAQHLSLETR